MPAARSETAILGRDISKSKYRQVYDAQCVSTAAITLQPLMEPYLVIYLEA